jgi:hypothetical protein
MCPFQDYKSVLPSLIDDYGHPPPQPQQYLNDAVVMR